MSSWGTTTYAVAEPGTAAPARHDAERRCCMGERCRYYEGEAKLAQKLNPYQEHTEGYLLCFGCQGERLRRGVPVADFVKTPPSAEKRGRTGGDMGGRRPRGVRLPGLDAAMARGFWSAAEVGRCSGYDGCYVASLRSLKKRASAECAAKIAEILGVTVAELRGEG